MHPIPNQGLSSLVRRMRLTGDDELHWALRIGQQAKQALWVVQEQVWSLVGREAASKAQRQGIGDRKDASRLRRPRTAAPAAAKSRDNRSRAYSTRDLLAAVRNCQSLASETGECLAPESQSSPASDPSTGFGPKIVSRGRVQVGVWTPLVTCPIGTSSSGPAREQRQKKVPAYLSRAGGLHHSPTRSPGLTDRPC